MIILVQTYNLTIPARSISAATPIVEDLSQNIISWTYSFSAKERDVETGLSYFGSRYYSSDLSIWLSVDPMSDKYASLSPYVYCADNPVRVVDPDGEDYEVVMDNDDKTITIKATYYVTNETKIGMETAFQYFTTQEKNLSYTNEDGETYAVKFDLSIAGVYDTWDEAYSAMNASGDRFANMCGIGITQNDKDGNPTRGQTEMGNKITINPDCILRFRTYAHEIGHTLGMGEWSSGLMKPGGSAQDIGLFNEYFQQTIFRTTLGARPDNIASDIISTKKTNWLNIGKGYIK